MKKTLRALTIGLVKITIGLVLVVGAFLGYARHAEGVASDRAKKFCEAIAAGTEISGILEHAISLGADIRQSRPFKTPDGQEQLPITFTGVFPLSRHICWITTAGGHVVSSKVVYLD